MQSEPAPAIPLTVDPQVGLAGENPVKDWLLQAAKRGASDLHLLGGYSPTLRLHGHLREMEVAPLTDSDVDTYLLGLLDADAQRRLIENRNADFAIELQHQGPLNETLRQRFRANYFYSSNHIGACFRVIPNEIPDLDWAGFPYELAEKLADFRNGLVISCGVTGSGKTTTLAMIIHLMIQRGGYRVVTIEEPIEYVFPRLEGSVVTQREVGRDVLGFDEGLKYSLRQDPDVILVGEIRDRETAQTALRAAETGHLVFASLHTRDAKGAISRYADLFPQDNQQEIRSQLSVSLRAVVSQHLIPSAFSDDKRVLALEVMFNNSPIAIAIRNGRMDSLDNTILTSRADGMITLNESIRRHFLAGNITRETAERFATDPGFLRS
jgi:twitching motility protein PilT